MTRALPPRVEATFWLLLTALGYFLLAHLSLHATKGADNIAAIWPPSGYFLALLLLMPARMRIGAFVGMVAASLSANMLGGAPPLTAAAFTLANACEPVVALWVLRRREPAMISFMVPRAVGSFCIAAMAASIVSAAIATLLAGTGVDFFLSWMSTVALGMLIVTPPIIMLSRMIASNAMRNATIAMKVEATAILTGAALLTVASFSQSHFPATFLPCVAVILASYRLGPFGAAAGMLIVAVIAALLTGQGLGPIAAIDGPQKVKIFFLQFYLVTMLSIALPLAALIVVRKRLAKRLEESNRWLLQAEAVALVGHWRVDLVRRTIQWSDQSYRIHGLEPGAGMTVEGSLACYLEDDRVRVRHVLKQSIASGAPFEFQGRIQRADGDVRHAKSHGSIEMDRNGVAVGIFGTIQDVTETVENARILEAARSAAERVANTDMLTGLPNRRQTLAFLEKAFAAARDDDAPLAVAIFDIDHFKRINDSHGHAVGDNVIRRVAQRAKAPLRDTDLVGRFGGEEFVCILRGDSALSPEMVAERVRKTIEAEDGVAGNLPRVTVSIGLAVYAAEASVEELLHRADKALYVAKSDGRNRLRMAA